MVTIHCPHFPFPHPFLSCPPPSAPNPFYLPLCLARGAPLPLRSVSVQLGAWSCGFRRGTQGACAPTTHPVKMDAPSRFFLVYFR